MADANKHIIPSGVVRCQKEYGCNHSEYVATVENEDVYSLSKIDNEGFPMPTGLPLFVFVKGNDCRVVSGAPALKLLDTLFVNE